MNRTNKTGASATLHGTVYFHWEQGTDTFCAFAVTDAPPVEGLRALADGDLLTIYSQSARRRILWRGKVRLRKGKSRSGVQRINSLLLQTGVSDKRWIRWLTKGMPATLVPATEVKKGGTHRLGKSRKIKPKNPCEMRGILINSSDQGLAPFRGFQDEKYIKPADTKTGATEQWLFQGLHPLKNGDHLTVFSKNNPRRKIWSGKLRLRNLLENGPTFDRIAFQHGVDPAKWWLWFADEYPAALILGPTKNKK